MVLQLWSLDASGEIKTQEESFALPCFIHVEYPQARKGLSDLNNLLYLNDSVEVGLPLSIRKANQKLDSLTV